LKVYAGHIIPVFVNGQAKDATEVEEEGKQAWEELWKKHVKEMLGQIHKNVKELDRRTRLELVANTIAIALRLPLTPDPMPPPFLMAPMNFYALWLFMKHDPRAAEIFNRPLTVTPLEELRKAAENHPALKEIRGPQLAEQLEKVMVAIPADTRPGLNTSKLLVHLMCTSAIAYALANTDAYEVSDEEKQALRIAALLHDVGKPLNWRRHVEESKKLAGKILSEVLTPEELDIIEDLIERHHGGVGRGLVRGEVVQILKRADEMASGIDRLESIVAPLLADKLGMSREEARRLLKSGSWEEWERYQDKMEELTTEIVRELRRAGAEGEEGPGRHENLWLLIADVRGIQNFVLGSEKLPMLIAGSYVVDITTFYVLPRVLYELASVPPEGLLLVGGGAVWAIVSKQMLEKLKEEALRGKIEKVMGKPLTLNVSIFASQLARDFRQTLSDIYIKSAIEKASIGGPEPLPYYGLEAVCRACDERPANRELLDMEVCESCLSKYRVGYEDAFKARWEGLKVKGVRAADLWPWDKDASGAREFVMEILAGHETDFESPIRLLNLAVLKADGNKMGYKLQETAISPSAAFEFNVRVDLALKKAYRTLEKVVREALKGLELPGDDHEEDKHIRNALRCYLGLLFMGGDDLLAILPSWLALPAAYLLANEFWKAMGGYASLSIGICSGTAKENIWALLNTAMGLLEEAKLGKEGENAIRAIKDGGFRGAVCFTFLERGMTTGDAIKSLFESYERRGLTRRSYLIEPGRPSSLETLLCAILDVDPSDLDDEELYSKLIQEAYKVHRLGYIDMREVEEVKRWVAFRDALRETAMAIRTWGEGRPDMAYLIALAHIVRCLSRLSPEQEAKRRAYRALASIIKGGGVVPILDLYFALKFVGGGAL